MKPIFLALLKRLILICVVTFLLFLFIYFRHFSTVKRAFAKGHWTQVQCPSASGIHSIRRPIEFASTDIELWEANCDGKLVRFGATEIHSDHNEELEASELKEEINMTKDYWFIQEENTYIEKIAMNRIASAGPLYVILEAIKDIAWLFFGAFLTLIWIFFEFLIFRPILKRRA